MRRTTVDLPRPGLPSTKAEGLLISPARWNQLIGSQQSVAPDSMFRPSGTPTIGVPVPAANGHRPHAWTVVARHWSGGWTRVTAPPPGPGHPRAGGRCPSDDDRARRRVTARPGTRGEP